MKKISESQKLAIAVIIAAAAIIAVITAAVLFLKSNVNRSVKIAEVTGVVSIMRNGIPVHPAPGITLRSGDIVSTSADATIRVSIDGDKWVSFEPNTSAYINYDGTLGNGSTYVNVTNGAVIARLDKTLPLKCVFAVKTPNSVVNAQGTVFRTEFALENEFQNYKDVYVTTVHSLEGTVALQLYDTQSVPVENSMLLLAGTSAQMISCKDISEYIYINQNFSADSLKAQTLRELIKICKERSIGFSLSELNDALFIAVEKQLFDESSKQTTVLETDASEITTTATILESETTAEETTAATTTPEAAALEEATTTEESPASETTTTEETTAASETTAETSEYETETSETETSATASESETSSEDPQTETQSETTIPIPAPVPPISVGSEQWVLS